MELGQSEALGVLHHHYGRVRHVDADFDHGGRDQHVDVSGEKGPHDIVLFLARPLAMNQADPPVLEGLGREAFVLFGGGL